MIPELKLFELSCLKRPGPSLVQGFDRNEMGSDDVLDMQSSPATSAAGQRNQLAYDDASWVPPLLFLEARRRRPQPGESNRMNRE